MSILYALGDPANHWPNATPNVPTNESNESNERWYLDEEVIKNMVLSKKVSESFEDSRNKRAALAWPGRANSNPWPTLPFHKLGELQKVTSRFVWLWVGIFPKEQTLVTHTRRLTTPPWIFTKIIDTDVGAVDHWNRTHNISWIISGRYRARWRLGEGGTRLRYSCLTSADSLMRLWYATVPQSHVATPYRRCRLTHGIASVGNL